MGQRGVVKKIDRVEHGVDVHVDLTDDDENLVTAEHYTPPGLDVLPLLGDEVVFEDADGQGEGTAVAYQDLKNPGKAEPGEWRFYARNPSGTIVSEVWLKGDGSVEVSNVAGKYKLLPDGSFDYNDGAFTCDTQGNAVFKGEVTAMAAVAAAAVKLSTHLHPTAMGPSGPPKPGP
jgi:hypothetical protein